MVYKEKFVASVKVKGKILREDNNTVYLPFGSEYSILLKNLNTRKALVKISVDDNEIINGLIVKPGQTSEIERFFDGSMSKGHKLKFIEKTSEISEYRGDRIDDGLIRVEYQFEKEKIEVPVVSWNIFTPLYRSTYSPPLGDHVGTTPSWQYTSGGTADENVFASNSNTGTLRSFSKGQNEEGITVKGDYSQQSFVCGYIGELEENSKAIIIGLKGHYPKKGFVSKPLTVKTKIFCEICGRRYNSGNKFCPNCGNCLI